MLRKEIFISENPVAFKCAFAVTATVPVCCLEFKARQIPAAHQAVQGWSIKQVMDSLPSYTDSLGLAGIAVYRELTTCCQLFSCGKDWNEQSQSLIHYVCALPGNIRGVIKFSLGDISTFYTSLEFARCCFYTCYSPEMTTETWQELQVCPCGSLSYRAGKSSGNLAAAFFSICCSWERELCALCCWRSRSHGLPSTAGKLKVSTCLV